MSGVNKVILVGNLGRDPEVRHLQNGVAIASFPIATSETYKDKTTGEKREQTEWHNIVLWRGLAEVAEKWLKKGQQVYIEGKMRTRSWEKDGITRYTTEIVGDSMTMLGGGSRSSKPEPVMNPADAANQHQQNVPDFNLNDDLPF